MEGMKTKHEILVRYDVEVKMEASFDCPLCGLPFLLAFQSGDTPPRTPPPDDVVKVHFQGGLDDCPGFARLNMIPNYSVKGTVVVLELT